MGEATKYVPCIYGDKLKWQSGVIAHPVQFRLGCGTALVRFQLSGPNIGVSPSGKAQDFDSCIPMVRIHLPQPLYWGVAKW